MRPCPGLTGAQGKDRGRGKAVQRRGLRHVEGKEGPESGHDKRDVQFTCAHDYPSSPSWRRIRMPQNAPAKAATNQTHPCKLPVEMPEKKAPTLQPKASRDE